MFLLCETLIKYRLIELLKITLNEYLFFAIDYFYNS